MDNKTVIKLIKKSFIYHGLKQDRGYKIFYGTNKDDNPTEEDIPFIYFDYDKRKAVYDIQIMTNKTLYNTKIDGITKEVSGNKVNVI